MSAPSSDSILNALNAAQRQAAEHLQGPLLVLAGPGSGKTRVLTHRMAYMISQGIASHEIVAMTFTNKAADEMRGRLNELVPRHRVWLGTFHKFCARLLRVYAPSLGWHENFTIYDADDSRQVLKQAIAEADINTSHYTLGELAEEISRYKGQGITVADLPERPATPRAAVVDKLYPVYQQRLQRSNAVDFDDLLLGVVQLLREHDSLRAALGTRYRYVLVDEYQDTNLVQYQIVKALCLEHRNLAVTGDPDQSIYGWRGANLKNILEFERDFPDTTVVRLEQNYRSTQSILRIADVLIQNNEHRKHKTLVTDNAPGERVELIAYPTQQEESESIVAEIAARLASGEAASQIAILYRANWLSRLLESALRGAGIPYRVVQGQAFFARREIKDVVAYLNLLSNPRDHIALERVINVPPRKIGKVTIARLRAYAAAEGISLLDAARQVTRIGDISKQAAAKVAAFVALYDRLNVPADNVEAIVRHVLAASGYREYLLADETDQGLDRVANVDELVEAAREFDDRHPDDGGLDGFLEQVSLVSDTDAYDPSQPAVSLMTLHAAKGLEFDSVFIVGVEEGLLPHEFSNRDQWEIEEERRLLFVGITRAKRHLRLSRALYRARHGVLRPTVASRFLMELPRNEMNVVEPRGVTLPDHWGDSDEADQDQDFADDGIDPFDESPHRPARRGASERRSERPTEPRAGVRLATAAQLAEPGESDARSPGVPPEAFQNGMIVNHPIYGLGRISSLSGSGLKRTAAIDFFEGSRRTFRLALSPLVPVRRRDS